MFFDVLIGFYYTYILIAAVFLILDNRRVASTFAWLLVFIILPVAGILFYILFGKSHRILGKKRKKIESTIHKKLAESLDPLIPVHEKIKADINKEDPSLRKNKLTSLLEKNSHSLLTVNNKVQLLQNGEEKFSNLMKDLQGARKFIHMAYFIWRDDELTRKVKDILIQKAGEGVEIRILVDAVGSFSLPFKYKNELRKVGIQIFRYFDFGSLFTLHTINYRNHRKIVVVDGKIGYTGGMNMGLEYIRGAFGYNLWRDTHLRILGEGVKNLQAIFGLEWENTTREKISGVEYFPKIGEKIGETRMQVAVSGPDSQWDSVKQVYFELICSAQKRVYIQSPYFVPDEALIDALKTAALSWCRRKNNDHWSAG